MRCVAKTPTIPYTSVSDVDAFFERVQTIAEPKPPKKVDSDWVQSYGFQTAHPGAIPSMLRWLGVIDDDGESTGIWNELRVDGTRQTTLDRLVRDAYSGIFDAIDVENATMATLRGAFVSVHSLGDPGRQIKCFLALCKQAGIKTAVEASKRDAKPSGTPQPKAATNGTKGTPAKTPRASGTQKPAIQTGAVVITLNVEIPAGWSEDQIRQRVAAVARAIESPELSDS